MFAIQFGSLFRKHFQIPSRWYEQRAVSAVCRTAEFPALTYPSTCTGLSYYSIMFFCFQKSTTQLMLEYISISETSDSGVLHSQGFLVICLSQCLIMAFVVASATIFRFDFGSIWLDFLCYCVIVGWHACVIWNLGTFTIRIHDSAKEVSLLLLVILLAEAGKLDSNFQR